MKSEEDIFCDINFSSTFFIAADITKREAFLDMQYI